MVLIRLIIHPQAAHRVVDGGIDAHRNLVGIFVGDALVHVEQIAVALANRRSRPGVRSRRRNRDRRPGRSSPTPRPSSQTCFGIARSHIARNQVAEAGIAALQIIIALVFRNLVRRPLVALLLRHPDAAVVAQRFAHQRQLRLIIARHRNAGGMNLREAGIGEQRAALVRAPDGGGVGTFGVGRKIVDVAVAAGCQNHRVGDMQTRICPVTRLRVTMPRAWPSITTRSSISVRGNIVDVPGIDLPFQRLIRAQQKLLAGLAARVKRARNLRAAEGPIGQRAAVFARERHALRHALVDDVDADLRQPIDVGFARAEIAAFHRVVEQADKCCRRRSDNSSRR